MASAGAFPRGPLTSQPAAHLSAAAKTLAGGLGVWWSGTKEPSPTQFPARLLPPQMPLEGEAPRSPGEGGEAGGKGCRDSEVGQRPSPLPSPSVLGLDLRCQWGSHGGDHPTPTTLFLGNKLL